MKNNPNHAIHTDYAKDDILKPLGVNQITEAIQYDYVITQYAFDEYIKTLNADDSVDIGKLLQYNLEETSGVELSSIQLPISIYIAANTGSRDLDFTSTLLDMLNTDAYKNEGQYTMEDTKDMVNIYSAHPLYVSNLTGGLNFWTSINNPVVLDNGAELECKYAGVCRIGCYDFKSQPTITTDGFQLVLSNFNLGFIPKPWGSLDSTRNYKPTVVVAQWFGNTGTAVYSIESNDSNLGGLYHSIKETVNTYKNTVILNVINNNVSVTSYQCTSIDSSEVRFMNSDTCKVVSIRSDGSINWNYPSGNFGSSNKSIILDVDLSSFQADYYVGDTCKSLNDSYNSQTTIYRGGSSGFKSVAEDINSLTYTWYNTAYNFINLYKFGSSNTLEWYTWFAMTAQKKQPDTIEFIYNNNRELPIDGDSLQEGIVYEINIHLIMLPIAPYSPTGTTDKALVQALPGENLPGLDDVYNIHVTVWSPSRYGGQANYSLKYWGTSNSSPGSPYSIIAAFNKCTCNIDPLKYRYSFTDRGLYDQAIATIQFVKLNGDIYVMKY